MDNLQPSINSIKWHSKIIKLEDELKIITDYLSGESLMRLQNKYGYNFSTIRGFLIKNGIKIRNVKESVAKFHKQFSLNLDNVFREMLIGWVLGDGGLRLPKHGINPYFIYTDKHLEYIEYVQKFLNSYNIETKIFLNKTTKCYQLKSLAYPEFLEFYNLFYGYEGTKPNGQKRKILPNITLTPIILKNWYIGDGCSCTYSPKCDLHRGMIENEHKNEFMIEQLSKICGGCKCYTHKTSFTYYFNNTELKNLLNYIGDCPVECYKYKWIIKGSTTIIDASEKMMA